MKERETKGIKSISQKHDRKSVIEKPWICRDLLCKSKYELITLKIKINTFISECFRYKFGHVMSVQYLLLAVNMASIYWVGYSSFPGIYIFLFVQFTEIRIE